MKNLMFVLVISIGGPLIGKDGTVVLFDGKDFGGQSIELTGDVPELKDTALGNDRASSVRIPPGCRVTLYEAGGFRGRSIMLTYDHPNFAALDLTGKVSSVKIDWSDFPDGREGIVLFSEIGYRGRSETLRGDDSNLKDNFIGNDRIRSLKVPHGWTLTVYEAGRFRGRSETFLDSDPDLSNNRVGLDRISSLRVKAPERRLPRPLVVLYHASDFRGRFYEMTGDDPDLSNSLIGNDTLSSLRVPPGAEVTLYEHANYRGRQMVITHDTARLRSGNDTVTSVRIRWNRHWSPGRPSVPDSPRSRANEEGVVLFHAHRFQGRSQTFFEDCPDLSATVVGNDAVSSIQVPKGYRVILYEHADYKGRSEVFTGDDPDLKNNRIGNDRVSSLKIERTGRRRRAH